MIHPTLMWVLKWKNFYQYSIIICREDLPHPTGVGYSYSHLKSHIRKVNNTTINKTHRLCRIPTYQRTTEHGPMWFQMLKTVKKKWNTNPENDKDHSATTNGSNPSAISLLQYTATNEWGRTVQTHQPFYFFNTVQQINMVHRWS